MELAPLASYLGYWCTVCHIEKRTLWELEYHITIEHLDDWEPFRCRLCAEGRASEMAIREHYQANHGDGRLAEIDYEKCEEKRLRLETLMVDSIKAPRPSTSHDVQIIHATTPSCAVDAEQTITLDSPQKTTSPTEAPTNDQMNDATYNVESDPPDEPLADLDHSKVSLASSSSNLQQTPSTDGLKKRLPPLAGVSKKAQRTCVKCQKVVRAGVHRHVVRHMNQTARRKVKAKNVDASNQAYSAMRRVCFPQLAPSANIAPSANGPSATSNIFNAMRSRSAAVQAKVAGLEEDLLNESGLLIGGGMVGRGVDETASDTPSLISLRSSLLTPTTEAVDEPVPPADGDGTVVTSLSLERHDVSRSVAEVGSVLYLKTAAEDVKSRSRKRSLAVRNDDTSSETTTPTEGASSSPQPVVARSLTDGRHPRRRRFEVRLSSHSQPVVRRQARPERVACAVCQKGVAAGMQRQHVMSAHFYRLMRYACAVCPQLVAKDRETIGAHVRSRHPDLDDPTAQVVDLYTTKYAPKIQRRLARCFKGSTETVQTTNPPGVPIVDISGESPKAPKSTLARVSGAVRAELGTADIIETNPVTEEVAITDVTALKQITPRSLANLSSTPVEDDVTIINDDGQSKPRTAHTTAVRPRYRRRKRPSNPIGPQSDLEQAGITGDDHVTDIATDKTGKETDDQHNSDPETRNDTAEKLSDTSAIPQKRLKATKRDPKRYLSPILSTSLQTPEAADRNYSRKKRVSFPEMERLTFTEPLSVTTRSPMDKDGYPASILRATRYQSLRIEDFVLPQPVVEDVDCASCTEPVPPTKRAQIIRHIAEAHRENDDCASVIRDLDSAKEDRIRSLVDDCFPENELLLAGGGTPAARD